MTDEDWNEIDRQEREGVFRLKLLAMVVTAFLLAFLLGRLISQT